MADLAELRQHINFRCVIGSRAYGLGTDASDTDLRGVFVPPARLHWSLDGVPEQIEDNAAQECYWEVEKFIRLALKGNPMILECLYSPIVLHADDLGRELVALRDRFLSRRIYHSYLGYADAQFERLNRKISVDGAFNRKQAMHALRLLATGAEALLSGSITVDLSERPELRDYLMAVRYGETPWETVMQSANEFRAELESAWITTSLPDEPDSATADSFLVKARRAAVEW